MWTTLSQPVLSIMKFKTLFVSAYNQTYRILGFVWDPCWMGGGGGLIPIEFPNILEVCLWYEFTSVSAFQSTVFTVFNAFRVLDAFRVLKAVHRPWNKTGHSSGRCICGCIVAAALRISEQWTLALTLQWDALQSHYTALYLTVLFVI